MRGNRHRNAGTTRRPGPRRPLRARLWILLGVLPAVLLGGGLLGGGLLGCGSDAATPPPPSPAPATAPAPVSWARLVADADARRLSDIMRRGVTDPDPVLRARAVTGIAGMRDPANLPLLRRALRDTAPAVRAAASQGLASLEGDAAARATLVLSGAVAAEVHLETRAAMLRDLGRLPTPEAGMVVGAALRSDEPLLREAACLAMADRALASDGTVAAARARMSALLGATEPAAVRLACAHALGRAPMPADPDAAQSSLIGLSVAIADADPDVRALVVRALGRHPGADLEMIANATRDPDWRVAVQAFRALATRAADVDDGPQRLAAALREAAARAVDEDGRIRSGGPLHTLLAALAAAAPHARSSPVHDLAVGLHARLGEVPADLPATRDRGLAHCAAAELTDRGRGWPSRVEGCGLEQVHPWERRILEAAVLGDLAGAEDQRLARLRRLFQDETPAVRQAVVSSAAKIAHAEATELVLRALRIDDPGVRAAAADALATIARRRPDADVVPPPLPVEAVVEALRAARASTPDDELETLVSWMEAADAADARSLGELVLPLALHPNPAVRHRARRLLGGWAIDLPEGDVPPPANPLPLDQVPAPDARPRVRLDTDRGPIVLELRPDLAPTTTARFLSLVAAGFYDDTTFHRVVPGFVAQGGDPRGDGYGGPGWSQRCEDHRLPYRRGTVGMALAGRDTGGSQFFLTHGPQPHLDGRYTAFGQVVEGLDRMDALQAGDAIRSASLVSQTSP